jgi:hypothetical protein
MVALAYAKGVEAGLPSAIALTKEALQIQRAKLAPTDQALLDTENRLAMLEDLVRS